VLQSMTDEQRAALTPIKLRRKARDFAMKAVKSQRDQFKRCATACQVAHSSYESCSYFYMRRQVTRSLAVAKL